MKNIIIYICLSAMLTSCGIFKNSSKYKERNRLDSVSSVNVTTRTSDKSRITITERVDTAVAVKGYTQAGEWKLNDGEKFPGFKTPSLVMDSTLTNVKIMYDSLSNSVRVLVKAKDTLIPVLIDKTTTIDKDVVKDSSASTNMHVRKDHQIKKKESRANYSWIIYVAIVGMIIFFIWWILHKPKRIL